jgi:hypothetical protein
LLAIFVNKKQPSQIIPGPNFIYKQNKDTLNNLPIWSSKMSLLTNEKKKWIMPSWKSYFKINLELELDVLQVDRVEGTLK